MKKYMALSLVSFFLVLSSLLICSCKGENKKTIGTDDKSENQEIDSAFIYPFEDASCFYADTKGYVFAYLPKDGCIKIYDVEGREQQEITTSKKNYCAICTGDDVIYAAYLKEGAPGVLIEEISMKEEESRVIYENELGVSVIGMERVGKNLFILEQDVILDMDLAAEKNDTERNYFYGGERLLSLSLENNQVKELSVDCVKGFCKKGNDGILVYAFDSEEGDFFFAEYNIKKDLLQEINYVGYAIGGDVSAFSYDTSDKSIQFYNPNKKRIMMAPTDGLNQQVPFYDQISEDVSMMYCQKEETYFLSDGKVFRITNSRYRKEYSPIRILSQPTEYNLPEGTGYTIEMTVMSEEAMATAIMAGDSDFDFLLLSSELPLAEQIRRTGAYDPLGDIEGVSDYLSSCFDYIGLAARDGNGKIWMFPYAVDCDIMVYNNVLCKKYGIDFDNEYSNEDLGDAEEKLVRALESEPSFFSYRMNWDRNRMLDLYLRDYAVVGGKASFDTEMFRYYAKLWKENVESGLPERKLSQYETIYPYNAAEYTPDATTATAEEVDALMNEYYSRVSMGCLSNEKISHRNWILDEDGKMVGGSYGISTYDFFDVKPMPSLDEENPQKSAAYAYFLVLNPKSNNKETAKEFLKTLSTQLLQNENFSRTKELKNEKNILILKAHEIYQNAEIIFRIPSDVCKDELMKYLRGEKSLDAVIPELTRKLNAYLLE